ncbi:MAG TPA: hypothetical protein VKM94_15750 [Blastocatellia bacterium]|nr:hypothetical protein [Blastocatellia bacterium]
MKTDREKDGLRGRVKTVHVEAVEFEDSDGRLIESPWYKHTIVFDEAGWLMEHVNHMDDNSDWRKINEYSDSGVLIATRVYTDGELSSEVRFRYDERQRLVAEEHQESDGRITTPITYAYDPDGRRTRIEHFECLPEHKEEVEALVDDCRRVIGTDETDYSISVSASQVECVVTRYDEEDEVVEVKIFNTEGGLLLRVRIERDARGNALEETTYNGDVVPFSPCESGTCSTEESTEATEGENWRIAADVAKAFTPGAAVSRQIHHYDAEGRLIESTLTMMGLEVHRQTFAYDEAGNQSEVIRHPMDDSLTHKGVFSREYDQQGNWTKEFVTATSSDSEFKVFVPVSVTRRVITYW